MRREDLKHCSRCGKTTTHTVRYEKEHREIIYEGNPDELRQRGSFYSFCQECSFRDSIEESRKNREGKAKMAETLIGLLNEHEAPRELVESIPTHANADLQMWEMNHHQELKTLGFGVEVCPLEYTIQVCRRKKEEK